MTTPSPLHRILGTPYSDDEADTFSARLLAHLIALAEPRMSEEAKTRAAASLIAGDAEGLARTLRAAVPDLDTRMSALLPAA